MECVGSLTLSPHFDALSLALSRALISLCYLSIRFQRIHASLLHLEAQFEPTSIVLKSLLM